MGATGRDQLNELVRQLWTLRHRRDHRLKTIVRGLLRADVARLRDLQQVTK